MPRTQPSSHSKATSPRLVGDLVKVRPHPTVVRLEEEAGASWIRETFLVTETIRRHLEALRAVLAQPRGCGAFLIGQYGSGKSHFLAYLRQSLLAGEMGEGPPRVATVSLLNYPASVTLEEIVEGALGLAPAKGDRRPAWRELAGKHGHGLVLLLDELSEFLRSKPDQRSFNEDVRFLQFLGEWAQGSRCWVVAALQEQIEHTGEIEYGLYRKIKDRYPLRLLLTPAHVEELVAGSILQKEPGYEEAVERLVADLAQAHPGLALDEEALRRLYPVHPATLDLLEEVRDRFSQARGVVDFVVGQLSGVPERGIPPFLERPWGSLLTPDQIVTHFADLFEVQPEFLPLAQTVLPYYRRELQALFPEPARAELAGRLLALLVLTHLSPAHDGLTAEEGVAWLLPSVSRLAPEKNRKLVAGVLERMATAGRYVTVTEGRFRLDLAEEGSALLDRLLEREKEALAGLAPEVLGEELAGLLPESSFNPLRLPRDAWQHRTLRWHFHPRSYAVFAGDGAPPPVTDEELRATLVVRLPWGERVPALGCYTLVPAALKSGDDLVELAALGRLRQRSWSPQARRRLEDRYQERLSLFASRFEQAYLAAELLDPEGAPQSPPRLPPGGTFDAYLERLAEWALRRIYPAFERFAPSHGPLPRETYRRFLRFAFGEELGAAEADEEVKLVREAYLVPLKLLRRRGRHYEMVTPLERHELVRQIQPLIEHRPTPETLRRHLASPPYGLVPDQVALLLAVLVVAGEADVVKAGRSLREGFETLPDPLAYDRVEPARGLAADQLRLLERLAAGLELPRVREWTAAAQRRVARRLMDLGRQWRDELAAARRRLAEVGDAEELLRRVDAVLAAWSVLEEDQEGELAAVERFLERIGSPEAFLEELAELGQLPDRLERLGRERQRFLHLFGHPGFAAAAGPALTLRREALGRPSSLAFPRELAAWLEEARSLYEEYAAAYRQRHDRWWSEVADHPAWRWQPPPIAGSPLLDLGPHLAEMGRLREEAERRRCPRLVDLAYQPVCSCGFDGATAPVAEILDRLGERQQEIEATLASYFAQQEVRERVAGWMEEGFPATPALIAYLEGEVPFPAEVAEPNLFDRYLAGAGVVKEVAGERLLEILGEGPWEPGQALAALERFFVELGASRLRFRRLSLPAGGELARWCGEQALRHGLKLPAAGCREVSRAVAGRIEPSWVGEATLTRLEELGFEEGVVAEVLRLLVEGRLEVLAPDRLSPVAAAAWELVRPSRPADARELALLAARLYRCHELLNATFGEGWRERLEALAMSRLPAPVSPLVELLRRFPDHLWLVVDGLGLPLVPALEEAAGDLFPGRTLRWLEVGEVPAPTTTDGWYGELLKHGVADRPITKIDGVDRLLHQQPELTFPELERLATAHLAVALGRLSPRLDPGRPLLIFADHGFRLAPEGKGFRHGGNSTLERLVPVWEA